MFLVLFLKRTMQLSIDEYKAGEREIGFRRLLVIDILTIMK
jgi:hypothetical protein